MKKLSKETIDLAHRYLTGEYYNRLSDMGFRVADLNLAPDCPPASARGKLAILTAEKSAIHILPEERLAGNASNIQALLHRVPGYPDEEPASSISHTTADFGDAVSKGLKGLAAEITARMANDPDPFHQDFFTGLLCTIEAMRIWTARYCVRLQEMISSAQYSSCRENLSAVLARLRTVPENPPETFAEAIQSFWSFFEFQRVCGNWSGLGRFDEILGPYLAADLDKGLITLDEARELIAHFWIKGSEWCFGLRGKQHAAPGSGDAQFYQNIILGGIGKDDQNIENDVTFLVLDVIEELHISDYPVTVRLNSRTSEKLLKRVAEVQLAGGGIVSVYNEPLIIRNLQQMGIPESDARSFTNDGCWEIIIPGQTNFNYTPKDYLIAFQEALFAEKTPESYGELYANFMECFRKSVSEVHQNIRNTPLKDKKNPGDCSPFSPDRLRKSDVVISLLMPSCRLSGCSYNLYGTKYVFEAIHLAGLVDVANSLHAIRENVFKKQLLTLKELVHILKNDWQGFEALRLRFANSLSYYGNDDPDADGILRQLLADCSAIAGKDLKLANVFTPVGVSTFGREIEYAKNRMATAFGKHAHEFLAPNLSPTPGTDKSPLTALLNSYCRMDFSCTPNGCPLDVRLCAGIRKVSGAADVLAQLLRTFVEKGGLYLQIDVVDPDILRAAKKDPDRFPNLVVRISGWSARFASLDEKWQDMIINRTSLEML
ncbi:MAG: hypothetical protein E7058_04755 [Lentisphaerae bacterium]|nr:hypothetical protein [Lentisphaerota bacterium]